MSVAAPQIFAGWWFDLDAILTQRNREPSRYWQAKARYTLGDTPEAAADAINTPKRQGVFA